MKVELEKIKLAASPLTGQVYIGITDSKGEKWLHKVEVTNQFYDCVLTKFLGSAKKKTKEISCGSAKWDVTVEQTHE